MRVHVSDKTYIFGRYRNRTVARICHLCNQNIDTFYTFQEIRQRINISNIN